MLGRAQDVAGSVGPVDTVVLSNVLHQIPSEKREPVLAACSRMLTGGGKCALNTMFYDGAVLPDTRNFYVHWMHETNAWLRSRGTGVVLHRRKPTALEVFSPQQHEQMLMRAGFSHVAVEEVTYEWTADDWDALCTYSVFIEGATGLSDVALGAEALKSALRTTFAYLNLKTVPRRWLFASGVKRGATHGPVR